ncbi:hypothetical protein Tco_0895693 [Tanacetum coccineum]|uniref:Uncharacterized protein n=1 Tax=Tanacetum coccineum TaxID=301880 RepID=A0ABQ5CIR3_9ASTR
MNLGAMQVVPSKLLIKICSQLGQVIDNMHLVLKHFYVNFMMKMRPRGFLEIIDRVLSDPQMVLKKCNRDIHGLALAIFMNDEFHMGAFREVHDKTRATGTGPTVKTTSKITILGWIRIQSQKASVSSVSKTFDISLMGASSKSCEYVLDTLMQTLAAARMLTPTGPTGQTHWARTAQSTTTTYPNSAEARYGENKHAVSQEDDANADEHKKKSVKRELFKEDKLPDKKPRQQDETNDM